MRSLIVVQVFDGIYCSRKCETLNNISHGAMASCVSKRGNWKGFGGLKGRVQGLVVWVIML